MVMRFLQLTENIRPVVYEVSKKSLTGNLQPLTDQADGMPHRLYVADDCSALLCARPEVENEFSFGTGVKLCGQKALID